jgi:hypothetical protein
MDELKQLPIDKHIVQTLIEANRMRYGENIQLDEVRAMAEISDDLLPFVLMAVIKRVRKECGFQMRKFKTHLHIMTIDESNQYSAAAPRKARNVFHRATRVAMKNALDMASTPSQRETAERLAGRNATFASFIKDEKPAIYNTIPKRIE